VRRDTVNKLSRAFPLPYRSRAREHIKHFTPSEQFLFWFFVILLIGSTFFLLNRVNQFFLVETPKSGGSLIEGVAGAPRFINPLLAISDSDRDLTALMYSGLLKATPSGTFVPDLAQSFEISENGLFYTFTIRGNAVFHDGTPVTADDVLFTIRRAQDPILKSPKRANWEGVLVEKIDERTVRFVLSQPYSPFIENVTIGILPLHIWNAVSSDQFPFSQFNVEPIGSGPYKIERVKRDSAGLPEFYKLEAFHDYALGKPFINFITLRFYAGEKELVEAYNKGEIDALNSISPEFINDIDRKDILINNTPLPRIFAVFFNQSQASLFTNTQVRRALDMALDKERIVTEVLGGYGVTIYNPIPPGIITQILPSYAEQLSTEERSTNARAYLEERGWEIDEETRILTRKTDDETQRLSFTLSTSNTPELKKAAQIIKESWERMGARVELKFFDIADLNQNVIRPRRYDALLFGEIIGRELDLFAFWHSSQQDDPGLNIALYANITADKLLEDARQESDRTIRLKKYEAFEKEVRDEVPAVFVYSPDFIYILPEVIKGFDLGTITTSSDRFLNVHEWHIETDRIWSIFTSKKLIN